jgi:hypothetical protein
LNAVSSILANFAIFQFAKSAHTLNVFSVAWRWNQVDLAASADKFSLNDLSGRSPPAKEFGVTGTTHSRNECGIVKARQSLGELEGFLLSCGSPWEAATDPRGRSHK